MNSSLTSKKLLSQPAYNLGPSCPNFYHSYKARAGPALGFGAVRLWLQSSSLHRNLLELGQDARDQISSQTLTSCASNTRLLQRGVCSALNLAWQRML